MLKKMTRNWSKFKKIVISSISVVVLLIFAVWLAFQLSPRPFVFLLNRIPQTQATRPAHFDRVDSQVSSIKNISYSKTFGDQKLDIYYPKYGKIKGTILWTHGGSFIGGDKSMLDYWGPYLAQQGYSFVSINYSTAPDHHYPTPLIQLNQAYRFLKTQQGSNQIINLKQIVIGGDSAGAQIASQYAAIQTNAKLAKAVKIKRIIPESTIKATLLFCGPYDLKSLSKYTSAEYRKFVDYIGWAYVGKKDWQTSSAAGQASTVDHVTENYPPSFVTDGNSGSFEIHAKKLIKSLNKYHVANESLFFSKAKYGQVHHEYQLDLTSREGKLCLQQTIIFLKKYVK
ncbi:alpha/beta hydrolase [Oenococcus sicerae]|uniref:Alpha/beta hydrolase n=1 Tax=Oenococcus sicerae TaxID=2203724 RepID=A0AAJ1R9D4_9LACO|nr:alpha/beta hydrolase [Oenococcus sicerae]MDN6899428.1 alpha/beta hydrolase [Oenococcus sicerae]QAS70128.1 alpha/beta hydrolase [Oenococcus sicerae]VDK13698.1 hypothetical protein OAL24_00494 [Oenococcus sicerae]